MSLVLSIDAGTTGVRAFAVDESGATRGWSYREFTQHFPQPGWVEHDATEIWEAVRTTLGEVIAGLAGGSEAGASHAPMPGVVVSTLATVGQRVREGDALLVIESMKLQTALTAPRDGRLLGAISRRRLLARMAEARG